MKRILFSMLLIGLIAFTANLILNGPAQTNTSEGTGVFSGYLSSEPSNLDPARGVDVNEASVQAKIFDGLVRYDESMKLVGSLAESWSVNSDGKEYLFKLHQNVFFHNGQKLTADDVVFSLDRVLAPEVASPRSWVLEKVEGAQERMKGETTRVAGIRKVDDFTVSIKLSSPFAPFMSLLTMPACYVLPHKSAEAIKDKSFFEKPAGTGPFKIVERVRDSYVRLASYQGYAGPKPRLAEIELRIIPENMKAEMEFESGNLDLLQLYPSNYERFRSDPHHSKRIHDIPAMNVFYVGFNNQKAPFDDVRVRKALNMLIDREKIINAVYQGRAVAANGSIPPGILGFSKDAKGYGYNPVEGKKLLKEAGYDKSRPLTFDIYQKSAQAAFEITRLIQGELKKHGVVVNLKPMEWSALKDSINKGEAPAFYLSWFGDYPDGENFLYPLFHSNNWGSGGNRARFKSEEIDNMIEEAVKIQDPDLRAQAYDRINRRVYDQAPWLYLWHCSESYLTSSDVSNIDFSPLFFCDKALTLSVKH
ncbi:MAG: peptide/nickel transport system substrate-binding protein [Clostridiales bacterium]|nr:peptide/nickel transport system substrate-binding protein [Clostridiales bacterium]MDN5283187.1 peptide/nickel transport system substrate-binding protein [Candidatus Ozemobacter sp.]